VAVGVTGKLAPLADDPIDVPPLETKYHLIVLPADVPFRFEVAPQVWVQQAD
jgi:hypothetical protein